MPQYTTVSDLVQRYLKIYGLAAIVAQIPSCVDGLKEVHRRLLVTLEPINTKMSISAKLVGQTMELHPHGDDSIYQAAARLGQSFEYNPTLIAFDSSVGTYAEPSPTDARYTKMKISEFAYDIFFRGVDITALPKKLGELMVSYEPVYLAGSVPTALLYANSTIGYGDSSYTLPHNLGDVCDLVVAFAQHMKTSSQFPFDYAKHVDKFIPDFPLIGTLTNHTELIAAYKRGEFDAKVKLDGHMKLTQDTINIYTLPYGVSFKSKSTKESLTNRIEDLLAEKGSWFDKNILGVKDLSDAIEYGHVCVTVKRGVSVFEAWERLKDKIQFSAAITSIPNYSDSEGYLLPLTQPLLLAMWYNARYNLLVASKKMRIMRLTERIRQTEALLIVCDCTDEVIAIIRGHSRDEGRQILQTRYDLTYYQADFLMLARLETLSNSARIELTDTMRRLTGELAELSASFANIPDEIASEAKAIKKKYPTPRRTKIPNYIGYVRIGGGCIQIESLDEIAQIIEDFPKVEMEIHMYDGPHLYKVSENNRLETGAIPKITTGDIYGLKSNTVITVNIVDGVACCVKGFVPGMRQEGYFYTTPSSRVISRQGEIRSVDITEEIPVRKSISRGAARDIIYVYPDLKQTHYVIGMNTSTPNVINIQRVDADRSKIAMNPVGDIHLVHSVDRHVFLNVPSAYLNRNATRVVEFLDLERLLGESDRLRIDLGQANTKSNKLIRLL